MIKYAKKAACDSKFRYRLGAVIAKGKRVLATGTNRIGYTKWLDRPFKESIHAESDAILSLLKARRLNDLVGSTLYVARINATGEVRMSKPCPYCHRLAETVGIKRIVYTNDTGGESEYRI